MTLILQLIQAAGKTSTILEDAFLVVGSLASSLEQAFSPYIQAFLPFLYPALKAFDDTQLCTVAVGVIGDICRALGEQSAQYANAFMGVLLEDLSSEVLNRDVKVSILSCFGDIALAIGPAFEPYMQTTMGVLRQAGAVQPNPVRPSVSHQRATPYSLCTQLDLDMVEYVASLREGILEAYTGVVTGLKNTEKCTYRFILSTPVYLTHASLATLLLPHIPHILELVQKCLADSERTDSVVKLSLGLIGDLADTFPDGQIKQLLLAEWIMGELRAKGRYSTEIKKTLRWAREVRRSDLGLLNSPDWLPQMVKRATA